MTQIVKSVMSKTLLAKKLVCHDHLPVHTVSRLIGLYDAWHELLRLQHRLQMHENHFVLAGSEVLIETPLFRGYTDDLFEREVLLVSEYASGSPYAHKFYESALSGGYFRYLRGEDIVAELVTNSGAIRIPDDFIEATWKTSQWLGTYIERGYPMLNFAKPCYLCNFCGNSMCTRRLRQTEA